MKKDHKNEYVGIILIALVVILAVVLVYHFYLSHPSVSNAPPVEAPTLQIDKPVGTNY